MPHVAANQNGALESGAAGDRGHRLAGVTPSPADVAGPGRFPWPLVLALALGQLVAWGTFYYAFAILMTPMGVELGWSKAGMNGALSLGLAVTGMASFATGRWIDRRGGRTLMTLGSILGAALLILWSQITELWQLYAVWVGIGAICATILYDPVFAVVARAFAADYRRAITTITLLGGLASTVFIPVTQGLVEVLGWRDTLLALAFIELPICAGIPWFLLRGRERAVAATVAPTDGQSVGVVRRAMRRPVYWLLVASFVSFALFYTALLFNLVPMLGERGFTTGQAVAVYAFIGPSQVVGRIALLTMERWLTATVAGVTATALPVGALVILGATTPDSLSVYVFAIAFGAGMGIKTIVQATAAPEFLGRQGYGALQGSIMTPIYAAQAASPLAAAMIWQVGGGYQLLESVLLFAALISAAAFALAAALASRRHTGQSDLPAVPR
jgi:MFS family permease